MQTVHSSIGNLEFRRGNAEIDFDEVHAILGEAANWLHQRGMKTQWGWIDSAEGRAFIRKRMEVHETYLVTNADGRGIATFTVQMSDPDMWGQLDNADSIYVHGLAIRRAFAGHGIGYLMLAFTDALGAQRGKLKLRLDCMAENARLCKYYLDAGFTEVNIAHQDQGIWASRLYERPTGAHPKRSDD